MRPTHVTFGALSRALAPPGGEPDAFALLGMSRPDSAVLEREHMALFGRLGPARVSPYEGVHRPVDLHTVLAAYAEAGLELDPAFRDRPDHVSAELACLEVLAGRREEAVRSRRDGEAQRAGEGYARFFRRHAWPWMHLFFDALAADAGYPLHQALGVEGARLVRLETQELGLVAGVGIADAPPAELECHRCGRPVGVTPPDGGGTLPPWAKVCLSCRVSSVPRRIQS